MSYVRMQLANHTVRVGDVVEIWDGDAMIAAIYSVDRGIRIISKYPKRPQPTTDAMALEVRFGKDEVLP